MAGPGGEERMGFYLFIDERHREREKEAETQAQSYLSFICPEVLYPEDMLYVQMKSSLRAMLILLVWFKNHRAKLKQAKQQLSGMEEVKTSYSKRNTDAPAGSPHGVYPASLVYTDHPTPSFQLSICSNFKVLPDHSVGHNIVHFGCCQNPNIYSLCPIMESHILSTGFTTDSFGSSSPQRS
ncbi:unnamed protein product [Nyctereutes procyonoides]|uniref:(raccoon dog) hypothetical protein n=1 Tax=Nyctereutes procyonoides TaxID=34880 RepID=A0A811ZZ44_NYCPR|nr:unnamed protein product [Nyctereutes procyonoides]